MFKKSLDFVADLFFPGFCLGCGRESFWICPDCFKNIEIFDSFYCPVCQKRLPDGKICKDCQRQTKLSRFFAAAPYEDKLIKGAIHKLKYNFVKDLAFTLASPIINFLKNLDTNFSDFLIIPIPLHRSREKWRGFNQAEEISKVISKFLNIPRESKNLKRIKNTPPQVEIDDYQKRKENIQGAFAVKKPEALKNRKIILIDDVYTSGSTMEECAKILKKSGAKEIWGVVVAR